MNVRQIIMVEQFAVVIALHQDTVIVRSQRGSSCGMCASKQGCNPATLGTRSNKQLSTTIKVARNLEVKVGDTVRLGIAESALIQAALLLYVLPLVALFSGAVIGDYGSALLGLNNELLTILLGTAGLVSTVYLTRRGIYYHRLQRNMQPVMLAIVRQ
jgi:sigma-E factor negative regulatory protein RseC